MKNYFLLVNELGPVSDLNRLIYDWIWCGLDRPVKRQNSNLADSILAECNKADSILADCNKAVCNLADFQIQSPF